MSSLHWTFGLTLLSSFSSKAFLAALVMLKYIYTLRGVFFIASSKRNGIGLGFSCHLRIGIICTDIVDRMACIRFCWCSTVKLSASLIGTHPWVRFLIPIELMRLISVRWWSWPVAILTKLLFEPFDNLMALVIILSTLNSLWSLWSWRIGEPEASSSSHFWDHVAIYI